MRRFEMREGTSSKFWEVEVRGKDVVVRFGRIGAEGQTKTKRAVSPAAAQADADKLVREKVGKGYAELGKAKAKAKATAKPKAKAAAKPTATPDVAAAWARIEAWFGKRPQFALQLRPGAKVKDIAAAEKALGVRFPDDLRASLRIHDGQEPHCRVNWLPYAQQLGALASCVECWKGDRPSHQPEGEDRFEKTQQVRQVHFHPGQVPFAGSPYWDYDRLLIDLAPGPRGAVGQVIARSDIDLVPIAPSFGAFLERLASDLERGKTKVVIDP